MRKSPLSLLLTAVLFISSCAMMSAKYNPPNNASVEAEYSAFVGKPFEDSWRDLVDYASSNFFAIENFEKDSGLMTLSFGTDQPSRYVDCGHWESSGGYTFSGPYIDYLVKRFDATVSGKMNILVKKDQPESTLVRVHARYVIGVPAMTTPGGTRIESETWVFDTGSSAQKVVSNPAPGTRAERICQPTYFAERAILDAIKR